jgi:regulatory protein
MDDANKPSSGMITKLEVQQRRKNRCSVYVNDAFAFGIAIDVLVQFGLKKGQTLSESDVAAILLEETKRNAKDRAIRFLSYRDRSEKEIRDKLRTLKIDPAIVDWVIAELQAMKLIDDARFASAFAQTKMRTKPMGQYLLRRELAAKGLSDRQIQETIDQTYQEHQSSDLAMQLAVAHLKKLNNVEPLKVKKRISDLLLRRGFSWDVVSDVLENLNISENHEKEES